MNREIAKRLLDARIACDEIATFTAGRTRDDMYSDRGLQLILQTLVGTIGEALGHVRQADADIAKSIPNIHRIIGMRNQIVHGYDSIDYGIVWRVSTIEVPELAVILSTLLDAAGSPEEVDAAAGDDPRSS